jgi:hypothetical protein
MDGTPQESHLSRRLLSIRREGKAPPNFRAHADAMWSIAAHERAAFVVSASACSVDEGPRQK